MITFFQKYIYALFHGIIKPEETDIIIINLKNLIASHHKNNQLYGRHGFRAYLSRS